jgi:predicted RNA-binding protein with RPS1 domain
MQVASVHTYGAFVRIPGNKNQGLVHRTQVSKVAVDDVSEVLQRGEKVWCKVISITASTNCHSLALIIISGLT